MFHCVKLAAAAPMAGPTRKMIRPRTAGARKSHGVHFPCRMACGAFRCAVAQEGRAGRSVRQPSPKRSSTSLPRASVRSMASSRDMRPLKTSSTKASMPSPPVYPRHSPQPWV